MLQKFCQYLKPISISLSPNTEKDDIRLALKLFSRPWQWKSGRIVEKRYSNVLKNIGISYAQNLEDDFRSFLGVKHAFAFNSGRSALMAILHSLGLQKGDRILLQAFTCSAVSNPILWSDLKPVYVDCDDSFNIDTKDLKNKITPKSRAVIVQHTFGLPANIDEIQKICDEHNLILIEDCAHSLGATYKGRKVGTFGKAAFFSFSRDKVISSVYGGVAVTNDDLLAEKLRAYQEKIGYPSYCWIARQLLHPILMNWLILPTYKILGKYLLVLFQWFGILSKAVDWTEKRGRKPSYFPKKMPDALAVLALNQFKKVERFNAHRKKIAQIYAEVLRENTSINTSINPSIFIIPQVPEDTDPVFLRFPVRHPKAHDIIKKCWQNNILIGDWYTTPIAPHDTKLDKMQYTSGSCPKAEKLAKETFNLPTHIGISPKNATRIVKVIKEYGS